MEENNNLPLRQAWRLKKYVKRHNMAAEYGE
jgi:hypothetical protein